MSFIDRDLGMSVARAGLALSLLTGACTSSSQREITPVATGIAKATPIPQLDTNLRLAIDEKEFRKVLTQYQFGMITDTLDKTKMDCLKPLGDICIAANSQNFRVALNRPMLDFMVKQSRLFQPSIPTRMWIVEDWLDPDASKHEVDAAGFTALAQDNSEQIIVLSLKAASLSAFQALEKQGLPSEGNFFGAVSHYLSVYAFHEAAHAGAETSTILRQRIPLDKQEAFSNLVHPQVYAFQNRYLDLSTQAIDDGHLEASLIFAAEPNSSVNLEQYKRLIMAQAQSRGILK